MRIEVTSLPDESRLPALVAEALLARLEGGRLLEEALPLPQRPLLLADERGAPLLVIVRPGDGGAALLAGVASLAALREQAPFVHRLYPHLLPPSPTWGSVMVVAECYPAGAERLVKDDVTLLTCQALLVEGRLGLLLQPFPSGIPESGETVRWPSAGHEGLTPEEEAFFAAPPQ